MSEAKTKIEIEDVLSSIRRLVSQDAAVTHHPARVVAARRAEPAAVVMPAVEALPEVADELADAAADDCLVLTPALRVEEPEAAPAAAVAEAAPEPLAEDEAEDLGDELSRLESTIAEMEAAVAESGIAFEPELGDHFEADGMPELEPAEALTEEAAEVAPVEAEAVAEPAPDLVAAEAFIWTRALSARATMRPGAARLQEAEAEVVEAVVAEEAPQVAQLVAAGPSVKVLDAARVAEEDLILEAETLHDLPSEEFTVADVAEPELAEPDLADVALAAEAPEIEPAEGQALVAEDVFGAILPEAALDEAVPEEAEGLGEAEEAVVEAADTFEMHDEIAPEIMEEAPEAEVLTDLDAPADHDPDLQDAAWDEAGTADWAVEGQAEAEDLPEIDGEVELPEIEDEMPEVTEIADEAELRRAHLADATAARQEPESLRSSYDTLRDEYAADDYQDADVDGAGRGGSGEAGHGAIVDEEALQALVAELIRRELRGALGERITQNVRKLVRREIQRALMNRDYE